MEMPCGHEDQQDTCPVCLLSTDPIFGRMWGIPPTRVTARTQNLPPKKLDCIYRGDHVGEEKCGTCAGSVRVKTFACELHGTCHLSDKALTARTCASCFDRTLPETFPTFLPGEPDPLPHARLDPPPPGWAKTPEIMDRHRAAWGELLNRVFQPPSTANGTGVVYTFNDCRYWPMLQASVKMLRAVSTLPVEIWYDRFDQFSDLTDIPDVIFRSVQEYHPRNSGAWESKALALTHCPWERVLYLDADAYPVNDPRTLLDALTPEKPFLYWEDLDNTKSNLKWGAFGIPPIEMPPVQGGQLAIHRTAAWRVLALAHWANQHSEYSYSHMFGDQDCWKLALGSTGMGYTCLGKADWQYPAFVCNFDNRPLFVHRCQGKVYPGVKYQRTFHLPEDGQWFRHVEQSQLMR